MTYIYEAAIRGVELGAVADINFEYAAKQAKILDEELKTGYMRGPLHGIPISVKDSVKTSGTLSFSGLISYSDNIDLEDGVVAKLLKNNGAIPFVKSNVPQLLMLPETDNRVFGVCKNPLDEERTSGGSSGGESSLISSNCSPAGIGTDIGGSIRIPAS
jgi:Asp-tRNA(Asn)/Glu-tRNA(Gln) amidotransferase A subunit family amidase